MKRFKKRTIALVLASVVTVVGAFGANNYKNSLTGIKFEPPSGDSINMIVQTKMAYDGNVTPIRKDANTYILTLPEMNSLAATPDLKEVASNIASVNIRTMPYSNTAKGYTRITIKTLNPSTALAVSNQVFIETSKRSEVENVRESYSEEKKNSLVEVEPKTASRKSSYKENTQRYNAQRYYSEQQNTKSSLVEVPVEKDNISQEESTLQEIPVQQELNSTNKISSQENTYLWLWALLIVLGALFFYTRAKNKMLEIAGEKLNIDVNDKEKKPTQKNLKSLRKTINTLDSAYSKTASMPKVNEYTVSSTSKQTSKPVEELNIVDLDELFQEHKAKTSSKTKEEEENDALEDFLSGFSFDDSEEIAKEIEAETFDEALYEKILSNLSIRFTKEDITCINQLLGAEIQDETMRNIEKYAVSNPIKKIPSKNEILENLVTEYTISQNILFSHDDINVLQKLVNVELDSDFLTDLRTNPQKVVQMEKDILAFGDKPKKPSEIVTLSVKDMLPDLSEALKLQGNKKIESNYKAETIYFTEGYDVQTLSLNDEMPDLSKEINKKESYTSKPSAEIQIVDDSFVVGDGALKISSELPDLRDVLAHPEKYSEPEPEEVEVDAEALLNSITNVQFKPFYDGTTEFEVLNDIPTISEVQAEFEQFEGFEIKEEDPEVEESNQEEYDDFAALYSNEYVDLDKKDEKMDHLAVSSESTQDLIKKIEASKFEREARRAKLMNKQEVQKVEESAKLNDSEKIKCILEGQTYTIVSSAVFKDNKGCYLAKNNNGYSLLGYIDERLINIKHFETLKSEKIHTRLHETLDDGTSRYLVRIGLQKIIVNVTEDDIKFVMDLC